MKKQVPSTSSSSSSTIKKRNIIGRSSFIEPKALSRSTINTTTNTNLTSSTTNRISSNNNISTPLSSNNNQQILENESISSASRANEIFSVGEKIYLHGLKKWGTVKYFGDALFSDGKWVGVELNEEIGRNDGTVQGHRYFTCKPKYGVFVRPSNCSKASNVPASTPRSSSATPNVRLTNRSTIRASVPNALHSSLMRNIEPEMKVNEPTEIDSPSNNKYTEDIEPSLPESPPLSSQKIRTEEIDINQLLLSDEFIQRVTEKILENNSNIRNNLTVITPHKNHSENETIDSNVNNRIVSLEQSLFDISSRLNEIHDLVTGIGKTPRRSLSTSVSWEDVQISSADELESLKSALAMVASLAKQAHEATLVERQAQEKRINELEEQLVAANSSPS